MKPPDDADPPPLPSPGIAQVNAWTKLIREAAQVKAAAKRKVGTALAAHKRSGELYDRVLTASERQVNKPACTAKQMARAEKAVDKQVFATHEALVALMQAKAGWQEACVKVEVAQRLRAEAKLESMRRRLRRRKVFGLMRWK